jgi:hypothetical protein
VKPDFFSQIKRPSHRRSRDEETLCLNLLFKISVGAETYAIAG